MIRKALVVVSSLLALTLVTLIFVVDPYGWHIPITANEDRSIFYVIQKGGPKTWDTWDIWKGEVRVRYTECITKDRLTSQPAGNYPYQNNDIYLRKRFGFMVRVSESMSTLQGGLGYRSYQLTVPLRAVPVLVLLFCTYPAIVFFRGPYSRYRRRRKGLCIHCCYNLTGNVSGICPECGQKVSPRC